MTMTDRNGVDGANETLFEPETVGLALMMVLWFQGLKVHLL